MIFKRLAGSPNVALLVRPMVHKYVISVLYHTHTQREREISIYFIASLLVMIRSVSKVVVF